MSNIIFPLNLLTSSFGLPDGESIRKFKEKLKQSAGENFMIQNTNECYLSIGNCRQISEAKKQGYLMLALCFGMSNEEDEITDKDVELKQALKYLVKQLKQNCYQIFTHNMKILGQAYPKLKQKFNKFSLKRAQEIFFKVAQQSRLLFRTKIRVLAYQATNKKFRSSPKYEMFKRKQQTDELMANDGHTYLLIVECEEYLNLGVIHSLILEYDSQRFPSSRNSNRESGIQKIEQINDNCEANGKNIGKTRADSDQQTAPPITSKTTSSQKTELPQKVQQQLKNPKKQTNSTSELTKQLNEKIVYETVYEKCDCFICKHCCCPQFCRKK